MKPIETIHISDSNTAIILEMTQDEQKLIETLLGNSIRGRYILWDTSTAIHDKVAVSPSELFIILRDNVVDQCFFETVRECQIMAELKKVTASYNKAMEYIESIQATLDIIRKDCKEAVRKIETIEMKPEEEPVEDNDAPIETVVPLVDLLANPKLIEADVKWQNYTKDERRQIRNHLNSLGV